MTTRLPILSLTAIALAGAAPAALHAQDYNDLPPIGGPTLAPLSEAEVADLPPEYRTAPAGSVQTGETVTTIDGVETITRTRRIDSRRPAPVGPQGYTTGYAQGYAQPYAQGYAPAVFEREQWIDECRRRTRGRSRDDTGTIIGGLLGAIAGGVAGYEIAGAGDRVLGTALGVGGGGLIGGLIGSLFGGNKKENLYDCEAALDSYLSAYGTPGARVATRSIPYPAYDYGYGYPQGYSYGYAYAPPQQVVLVPVRTEVQQQVVVRETVREETYSVPGATRLIPAPARPSPKMIKNR